MSIVHQQPLPGMAEYKRQPTASELLQIALEKESGIEIIERITALMERERDYQAHVAFDEALNNCQSQIGRIAPNSKRENGIQWLDYAGLDKVIRPIYIKDGFSIAFSEAETADAMRLRMKATLSRGGYSRDYFAEISRAAANSKMSAQDAAASAASRVKRYLLLDIFNIAVGIDKDEKAPYTEPTEEESAKLQEWVDSLRQAPDMPSLKQAFDPAYKYAKAIQNNDVRVKILDLFEERKRVFLAQGGGR